MILINRLTDENANVHALIQSFNRRSLPTS